MFKDGYFYKLRSLRSLKNEYDELKGFWGNYIISHHSSICFHEDMYKHCGEWVKVEWFSEAWRFKEDVYWLIHRYMIDQTKSPVTEVADV